MSDTNNGITGRDGFIIRKALAYGIVAICQLPKEQQEYSDMQDMRAILNHLCIGLQLGSEFFIDNAMAHLNGDGFNDPSDPRAR